MEGPSLLILKEELQPYIGKKIIKVSGNTRQPKTSLKGTVLSSVDTWAKVLFMTFVAPKKSSKPVITKTHFLMFGSYRINDPKENRQPRLELKLKNGILYFYTCSIKFGADEYLKSVDRKVDVMSEHWDLDHVLHLMKKKSRSYLCDLLLDQTIFAGSGNIVKNEVLFNIRRNPKIFLSQIPKKDWPKVALAVRDYCWNFYDWKKKYELRKHWQIYRNHVCPLCKSKLVKESTGRLARKSFYCPKCQKLKPKSTKLKVFEVLPMKNPKGRDPRIDH